VFAFGDDSGRISVYVQSRSVASPRAFEVTLQWQHEWQAAQGSVAFLLSQTGLAPLVMCVGLYTSMADDTRMADDMWVQ
jgi:hypothetical protein